MINFLEKEFGIDKKIIGHVNSCEDDIKNTWSKLSEIAELNQYKVLSAFKKHRLSDSHFAFNTGYGYDDAGREITEQIFADVFGAETALVRTQIVNGTHALSITFAGILRPNDTLLYCTGAPYDSLQSTIGITGSDMGSLKDFGIRYKQIELGNNGKLDYEALREALTPDVKMVALQRATGYSSRPAIIIDEIAEWVSFVKNIREDIICMVDNCYGEFMEFVEPTAVGVDIMAGSLIKNPGGGLTLSGGYVAGRKELVEKVSYRLTCPGIGGECGLTFGQTRSILQGFFLAPGTVINAVKGAILCGSVFEKLGFYVKPGVNDNRSDIVQTIRLGNKEAVIAFCEGIQSASTVDAFVSPIPAFMPGYEDDIIMASGGFVTGSTIELSADAPIREPYNVYFQGGLTYEHAKIGIMVALQNLYDKGLINVG